MNESDSPLQRVLLAIGGAALLIAMAMDALAVIGRHTGVPLLGSIEVVQAAVLISGGIAMLLTTLARAHASVHVLVDRLPRSARLALRRLGRVLGALLYLALLGGSVWIAWDLWAGHEESELLHLPYRPLRLFTVLAAAGIAITFAAQAVRGEER